MILQRECEFCAPFFEVMTSSAHPDLHKQVGGPQDQAHDEGQQRGNHRDAESYQIRRFMTTACGEEDKDAEERAQKSQAEHDIDECADVPANFAVAFVIQVHNPQDIGQRVLVVRPCSIFSHNLRYRLTSGMRLRAASSSPRVASPGFSRDRRL